MMIELQSACALRLHAVHVHIYRPSQITMISGQVIMKMLLMQYFLPLSVHVSSEVNMKRA